MRRLVVLEEVDSTNTWLKNNKNFHRPWTGVRALRQTAGRGRHDRQWQSGAPGVDLTCSFILPAPNAALHAAPLLAAWALHRTVSKYADVRIKWPNDLLCDGKKMAGILCESLPHGDGLVIVGVGLNINSNEFPPEISAQTVSLALVTGKSYSVEKIWLELYRDLVQVFRKAIYPLPAEFIQNYNAVAYRYVRRSDIAPAPLEFKTLLADGRASFIADDREIILTMAE